MRLKSAFRPFFVIFLLIFASSSALADTYRELLERQIHVQELLDKAFEIDSDGGLLDGVWQSKESLQAELDGVQFSMLKEIETAEQKVLAQMNMITLARNMTNRLHEILDKHEKSLPSREEASLFQTLRLVKEGLSSVKKMTGPAKEALFEIERLLHENNIALLKALTKFPELQNSNLIGAGAFKVYHFDFDSNEKFGLRFSSKGRLTKAHQERFPQIGISTRRGLGLQALPFKVENGYQEAVVHALILLGHDIEIPWLPYIQNEHQMSYVLQLLSVAFSDHRNKDVVDYIMLGINGDRIALIDSNEVKGRLLLLELEKLQIFLQSECDQLLKD